MLVHSLGAKGILRTKDFVPDIPKAEIEDLLRDTLPIVARDELSIDVVDAVGMSRQPIIDVLAKADKSFSKYRLAKAFVRWSRDHDADDLSDTERDRWSKLINAINAALK